MSDIHQSINLTPHIKAALLSPTKMEPLRERLQKNNELCGLQKLFRLEQFGEHGFLSVEFRLQLGDAPLLFVDLSKDHIDGRSWHPRFAPPVVA